MGTGPKREHELNAGDDHVSSKRRRASDQPVIPNDQYTVGWICALPLEMAAAKGMLDELHPDPLQRDPGDHNTYRLGEVCGHNVVVACLPAGNFGVTSAATVATHMLRTFKSVRFGLMVGIGGGIPSASHDIRLGDVVVSQPGATNGGVIQYDRGKSLQEQGFERTGMLNAPPRVLLSALGRLQADHLTEDSRIPEFMAALPHKMKKRFSHPGASNDCLYLAEYPHVIDNSSCQWCDPSQIVAREDRDDSDPVIHYGSIASGNQVIKDATLRDQLGKELGVICFEMEAAGLQDFPSIVIRGICDYSDSHKNKAWQFYAATTAAAFAKELLSVIPPSRVLQENPIPELVSIASEQLDITKRHLELSSRQLVEHERTNQIMEDRPMDLHCIHEARYDSADVGDSARCEKNTRVRIQQVIRDWADAADGEPFLWLVGPAGTGKSTLVRSVADSLHEVKKLVAGYFFKRGEQGRNDTNRLFSTLAMQMADNVHGFKASLRASLGNIDKDSIDKMDLGFQFEKLLKVPLEKLPPLDSSQDSRVIVLDALDECERPENLNRILAFISEICNNHKILPLRVLLTSRPVPGVIDALQPLMRDGTTRQLPLNRVFTEDTKTDIRSYLETNFMRIRTKAKIRQDPWPTLAEINHLVELCTQPEPLFIYAATLVRFVYDEKQLQNPKIQLRIWLKQCRDNESQLHQMYNPILEQIFAFGRNEDFDKQLQLLGSLVLSAKPLSLTSLTSLLALDADDVNWWLPGLRAVLDIPSDPSKPIRLLHKSFSDFLFSADNTSHTHFQLDASETHRLLAEKCIELMKKRLKRDICCLHKLDAMVQDVSADTMDRCIPFELEYSCLYWVYHLRAGRNALKDYDMIYAFLLQHFLHWLEVLSILGQVSDGYGDLQYLINIPKQPSGGPFWLNDFLEDATSTILSFASIIESTPLQAYASLLLFSPATSKVRQQFWNQRLPPLSHIEGIKSNWDAHLRTLDVSDAVTGLSFSSDGRFVASAGSQVRVWSTSTGNHLMTFDADASPSNVTFSPNSQFLAATYPSGTVKVWDRLTWKELYTIKCPNDSNTIAFSLDSELLVLVGVDTAVHFWSVRSGALQRTVILPTREYPCKKIAISPTLEQVALYFEDGQFVLWSLAVDNVQPVSCFLSRNVSAMAFSPHGNLMAVEHIMVDMSRCTIRIDFWHTASHRWNYPMGPYERTIDSFDRRMNNFHRSRELCFLPRGRYLATISDVGVRFWKLASASYRYFPLACIKAFAFSSDSQLLATSSIQKGFKIWDLTTIGPEHNQRVVDDNGQLLFSPNGMLVASQVESDTVRIWDSVTGVLLRSLTSKPRIGDIQFSPDSKLLASDGGPSNLWIWDVRDGTRDPMLESQMKSFNCSVAYTAASMLACACWDGNTLNLYDAANGGHLSSLQGQANIIRAITFSPDGNCIASLSMDSTIQIWNTKTRESQCIIPRPEGTYWGVLRFSPDGKILAHHDYSRISWWDVATGDYRHALVHQNRNYKEHSFSPNSALLAASFSSGSEGDEVGLYNAKTTKHQSTLAGHSGDALEIVFSPDSSRVAVASSNRIVGLWDTTTGMLLYVLETHSDLPEMTRFSRDGSIIAVASRDMAIRLWNTTTGKLLQMIYYEGGFIQELKVLSDELIVSLSDVESGRLWDPWNTHTFKLSNHSYPISSDMQAIVPERFISELSLDLSGQWVMRGEERIICIPPKYRPKSPLVDGNWIKRGHTLVYVRVSGEVVYLRLPLEK